MPQPDDAIDAQPVFEDAPTDPLVDMSDEQVRTPHVNEPQADMDDTHDFYREVDEALEVEWEGEDLTGSDGDHLMTPLVDVLRTVGVSATDATMYAVQVIKNQPKRPSKFGVEYQTTFFELYGHGTLVNTSHGCRRNLNIDGLHAMDLRTVKPCVEHWDFSKASGRKLARSMVEELKPTWVVGSPPCTFFSAWNQGFKLRKMDPDRVEAMQKQAVMHLHFVAGIYRMQIDAGRHFLHEHPAGATS